jgi:hypothetical protein
MDKSVKIIHLHLYARFYADFVKIYFGIFRFRYLYFQKVSFCKEIFNPYLGLLRYLWVRSGSTLTWRTCTLYITVQKLIHI